MKVKLVSFLIIRSMDCHIQATVPKYESEILHAVHGDDSVVENDDAQDAGVFEIESPESERERLRLKYGLKNQETFWVDYLFPRQAEFAQAVKDAEYIEPEETHASPYSTNTRDELKAVLDGMLVKYPANASKDQLVALVEANAPAV